MCGGLAAGLVVVALTCKRRDLLICGLALGLSASVTYSLWFSFSVDSSTLGATSWITFSLKNLLEAESNVRQLVIGGHIVTIALPVLLLFALSYAPVRPLTLAFGIAFALFIALPVLISMKTPIIYDRYWLIGCPALVVLMVFIARDGLADAKKGQIPLGIGAGAVAFLFCSSVTGFTNSVVRMENKPIWKGANIASPLIRDCPEGSVHISYYPQQYAEITHAPVALFADARSTGTATITPSQDSCPVLGWGEHIFEFGPFLANATDKQLLALLKIDAAPSEVDIRRHKSGFVVLKHMN